jgi:hypothetical protein
LLRLNPTRRALPLDLGKRRGSVKTRGLLAFGLQGDEKMNERKPPPEQPAPMDSKQTVRRARGDAALGRDVQAKIGQQLRAYYDGLLEPTPDKFADLLSQLDKPGEKGSSE